MKEEQTYLCADCRQYFSSATKTRWFSSIRCPHCNSRRATPVGVHGSNPRSAMNQLLGKGCGSKSGFS